MPRMRFQLVSDIHAEFHQDGGLEFFRSLQPDGAAVLVIAGDIGLRGHLEGCLQAACTKWKHIVMVLGNHDLYQSNSREVWETIKTLEAKFPNLHVLENSVVTIEGQRFIGCTLWFPDLPRSRPYRTCLNDFGQIREFPCWFFEQNQKSVSYLRHNVHENDVVVTHHIPLPSAVEPRFRNDPVNDFFLCDMTETIWTCTPKAWVFGHQHTSWDSVFASTRFVCNPFGYLRQEENPKFNWNKIIDL